MALRTPSARTVAVVCGAVVLAGVVAVVGISLWAKSPGPARAGQGPATTAPAVTGTATAAPGSSAAATAGAGAGASASAGATASAGTGSSSDAGATPSATSTNPSELSPGEPQTIAPQPPPSPHPTGPSLTGPLPPAASARGETLVAGFPSSVVPVLDGVRVVSSSVSSEDRHLQAGLEASSDADPETVTSLYAATFRGAGFTVGTSPALPGSTATQFTRGPDGIVLTVTDRVGGGTELVISASLTTTG